MEVVSRASADTTGTIVTAAMHLIDAHQDELVARMPENMSWEAIALTALFWLTKADIDKQYDTAFRTPSVDTIMRSVFDIDRE